MTTDHISHTADSRRKGIYEGCWPIDELSFYCISFVRRARERWSRAASLAETRTVWNASWPTTALIVWSGNTCDLQQTLRVWSGDVVFQTCRRIPCQGTVNMSTHVGHNSLFLKGRIWGEKQPLEITLLEICTLCISSGSLYLIYIVISGCGAAQ